ncbi:ABC transporter ATPase [Pasteurellaceae bacterium LFhippo2]|nr:ABC transporter ATPase [Pasteurellaceae bacterium LFhippo2]
MLKKILCAALLCVTATASANGLKTSSLSIAKTQSSGKLSAQCQQMFKKADKLISDAEKQPGTHVQISQMKSKLSSTKQQILKLDGDMQQKSCDKGLIALNDLEKKY